jgi:hypothetical protein
MPAWPSKRSRLTARLHSEAITRGAFSCPDQRFILLISHVADPVKPAFYLRLAADPGRQGGGIGVAVAGNEVHDPGGLPAFPRDRAADLRDLGGAGEPGPGRHQHGQLLGLLSGGRRTSSGFGMPAWTVAARPPSVVILPGASAAHRRVSRKGLKPVAKDTSTQGNLSPTNGQPQDAGVGLLSRDSMVAGQPGRAGTWTESGRTRS